MMFKDLQLIMLEYFFSFPNAEYDNCRFEDFPSSKLLFLKAVICCSLLYRGEELFSVGECCIMSSRSI